MSVTSCTTYPLLSGDSIATEKSFLYDLITRVFLRSLQYGIVVLGFLDAFVYAHHQHRQGLELIIGGLPAPWVSSSSPRRRLWTAACRRHRL